MSPLRRIGAVAAVSVVAGATAGCATSMATDGAAISPAHRAAVHAPRTLGRALSVARHRWSLEVNGPLVHSLLRMVAGDPGFAGAVRSGSPDAIRSAVAAKYKPNWYHRHVSRLVVVQSGRVVVDVGVPFVVEPATRVIRDARGRTAATIEISEQDVIGFVRYMKRNDGIDTVVRGTNPGDARAWAASALHVKLPSRGHVTIRGRRYAVGSFAVRSLGSERVRVWVLLPE
jgi:hypothetical protein